MTMPKQRLPGTTYFVTGVCERHEFRLKPSKETNAAFAVSMMEAADRFGIEILAVCQMSSHYHSVVHDRYGFLSEYLRDFHSVMGRFGSARDEVENCKFWSSQDSDTMVLGDIESIIEKVAYTLANPTKDYIVERPEDWIGVRTKVADLGTGRGSVHVRPKRFFDAEGRVSEVVMVSSELPHEIADRIGVERFRERVAKRLERYVAEAKAEVRAGRASFMGLAKAKRFSVWHATGSPKGRTAGRGAEARRRVAAASKGRLSAMLDALVAFREAHRAAWLLFRQGLEVVFPAGTWVAWRYYGARRESSVAREAGPLMAPS
jgi:hypothetical protein